MFLLGLARARRGNGGRDHVRGYSMNIVTILVIVLLVLAILYFARRA